MIFTRTQSCRHKSRQRFASDECIHNTRHALTAIDLKSCRIINIKLWGASADTAKHKKCNRLAEPAIFRCGAAECWRPGLDERTTLRCRRCRALRFPQTSRPVSDIGKRDIIEPAVEVTPNGRQDSRAANPRPRLCGEKRFGRETDGAEEFVAGAARRAFVVIEKWKQVM